MSFASPCIASASLVSPPFPCAVLASRRQHPSANDDQNRGATWPLSLDDGEGLGKQQRSTKATFPPSLMVHPACWWWRISEAAPARS
nr:hypothetical protein Iba_chr09eCG12260 [Ipomoea batatas]